jgi:CheY-like chemotaxis protein
MMPVMDGFEFLDEFRKSGDHADIPVIIVTAQDLTEEDRLRLNGHVREVLHKGMYSSRDLLNQIRETLRTLRRRTPLTV